MAWRTLTSLNGGWSTRMVKGMISPECDTTVLIPLVVASEAICGPSSVPAPSMTPVDSASWSVVLSLKSMMVRVSTWGSPAFQ